jgi:hypothetical protein
MHKTPETPGTLQACVTQSTTIFEKGGKAIWMLDFLGCLTKKTSLDERIKLLGNLTDRDNVHLSADG